MIRISSKRNSCTPNVYFNLFLRVMSLDEAYLDVTEYAQDHSSQTIEEIVAELRQKIFEWELTRFYNFDANSH